MTYHNEGHYKANKPYYFAKALANKKALKALVREAKSRPCTDCGIEYPWYVMQFDHVSGTKVRDISSLANRGAGKLLREELLKCEVVCANCHFERTYRRSTVD